MVMQENCLKDKDKVNFKTHGVTTWLTNNCNTDIAQYLMTFGQLIEYFSSKIMQKMSQGE